LKVHIDSPGIFRGKLSQRVWVETEGLEAIDVKGLLQIIEAIFRSEDIRYPKSEGYKGRDFLFEAIADLWKGMKIEAVLEKYKIPKKIESIVEFM